jgi:cysteine-rich repeat protein
MGNSRNTVEDLAMQLDELASSHALDIIYAFGGRAEEVASRLGGRPPERKASPGSDLDIGVKPAVLALAVWTAISAVGCGRDSVRRGSPDTQDGATNSDGLGADGLGDGVGASPDLTQGETFDSGRDLTQAEFRDLSAEAESPEGGLQDGVGEDAGGEAVLDDLPAGIPDPAPDTAAPDPAEVVADTGTTGQDAASLEVGTAGEAGIACVPSCDGKECGDDGCGGQCGCCPELAGAKCKTGKCIPACGNGECSPTENECTCPADCGICVGCCFNGCDKGFCELTCEEDGSLDDQCGEGGGACKVCGYGRTCQGGQCMDWCGDKSCSATESCVTCPLDCGQCVDHCGDFVCEVVAFEDPYTCPEDCGGVCGNGQCDPYSAASWFLHESCFNCRVDCGDCCGDELCQWEFLETCWTCPDDCGPCDNECGDGVCGPSDGLLSCEAPWDCGENCRTCALDCGPCCGDGKCFEFGDYGLGETCLLCPQDCGECEPKSCGNGMLEVWLSEQCDDGNQVDGDGCNSICRLELAPLCGNGQLETSEECDDGNNMSGDGCGPDCSAETKSCGDGILDPIEQCDDGNAVLGDGCGPDCRAEAVCGNGILEPTEDCDDGNTVDTDVCPAGCDSAQDKVRCGDGIVSGLAEGGTEECDDGCDKGVPGLCQSGVDDGDGCNWLCVEEGFDPSSCNNGLVEPVKGEECFPGAWLETFYAEDSPYFYCNDSCQWVPCGTCCPDECSLDSCGDGIVNGFEECDDGNGQWGDGCNSFCKSEVPLGCEVSGIIHHDGQVLPNLHLIVLICGEEEADCSKMLGWGSGQPGCTGPASGIVWSGVSCFPQPYKLQFWDPKEGTYRVMVLGYLCPEGIPCGPLKAGDYVVSCGISDLPLKFALDQKFLGDVDVTFSAALVPPGSLSGSVDFAGMMAPPDRILVFLSTTDSPPFLFPEKSGPVEIKAGATFPAPFSFQWVPTGEYYVVGHYDKFGDLDVETGAEAAPTPEELAGSGDMHGGWPTGANLQKVVVSPGKEITGIDFVIDQ